MFGSSGLKVGTKVFAMLVKGELVVKLPKHRVAQLVASGDGAPFDPGHGRLMKEWVTSPLRNFGGWEQLADEALQFVGSAVPGRRSG
jgi:TfoX/Sxy family transcriptional regulator of competence genes